MEYYFFIGISIGIMLSVFTIGIFGMFDTSKEPEPKSESPYVSCEDCKYLIKRHDAQWVKDISRSGILGIAYEYYCPRHKKKYDEVDVIYQDNLLKTCYFKSNVEVDKNGKLIK